MKISGTLKVGEYEYVLNGEIDKEKDNCNLRIEAKLGEKEQSNEAWELLRLVCLAVEEIASKEVEERYYLTEGGRE